MVREGAADRTSGPMVSIAASVTQLIAGKYGSCSTLSWVL